MGTTSPEKEIERPAWRMSSLGTARRSRQSGWKSTPPSRQLDPLLRAGKILAPTIAPMLRHVAPIPSSPCQGQAIRSFVNLTGAHSNSGRRSKRGVSGRCLRWHWTRWPSRPATRAPPPAPRSIRRVKADVDIDPVALLDCRRPGTVRATIANACLLPSRIPLDADAAITRADLRRACRSQVEPANMGRELGSLGVNRITHPLVDLTATGHRLKRSHRVSARSGEW